MVYEYKVNGLYPIPAQDAGEELDRIYRKHGRMDAKDVVDESRPDSAPLHPVFEWDDCIAAEKYREDQARALIRCIVTSVETKGDETVEVRAFPNVSDTYRPLNVVLKSKDMEDEMRESALREFLAFKRKLEAYKYLDAVKTAMREIDRAIHELNGGLKYEETR